MSVILNVSVQNIIPDTATVPVCLMIVKKKQPNNFKQNLHINYDNIMIKL